jgi:hypothetical protein
MTSESFLYSGLVITGQLTGSFLACPKPRYCTYRDESFEIMDYYKYNHKQWEFDYAEES